MHLKEILRQHHFDISSLDIPKYQHTDGRGPVYLLRVPSEQALLQWEGLRNLVLETNYWPVIGWDRFQQSHWEEDPIQDTIDAGLHLDLQQWFEQQWIEPYKAQILHRKDGEIKENSVISSHFAFRIHLGRFPYTDLSMAPIALVPTSDFWTIPAYLSAQANEWDPSNAVHIAIMKYWNERWQAELVSMVPGVMEMRVLRPPTTFDEAFALAKEQYAYSPDLVDQELRGNINVLARMLLNGHIWRFWWD